MKGFFIAEIDFVIQLLFRVCFCVWDSSGNPFFSLVRVSRFFERSVENNRKRVLHYTIIFIGEK